VELGADRLTLNGELRGARNSTMLRMLGNPRGNYDQKCRAPTNNNLLALIVTRDVGPFGATGLRPAIEALGAIFVDVKAEHPDVFAALSSAGMLCCRFVRDSTSAISNHSWGTAIDLKIEGVLDKRGDGRAQRGLIAIHPIFNRHGFYWGAAFPTEDAMHFEASDQKIQEWSAAGLLGAAATLSKPSLLELGDRGSEVRDLQNALNQVLGLDLDVDGIFGPATRAAVIQFQRDNGETMDGVVTAAMMDRLRKRLG
jgi:hypothetical protein